MAHEITYALVEIDDEMSREEIEAKMKAADPAFFVAEMTTVTMEHLENMGTPTIEVP